MLWNQTLYCIAETFSLHLIQYSIKLPEYLADDSSKRFGPYMIYVSLLLSILFGSMLNEIVHIHNVHIIIIEVENVAFGYFSVPKSL